MQKPLLIDLDGVLRIGNNIAPDVEKFLDFLNESEINSCILSNSSLFTSKNINDFFSNNNINLKVPIITAVDAAIDYVKSKYSKVAVYLTESMFPYVADLVEYENPEAVLIGDIGEKWNYKLMQQIFEYVQKGAELVAIHKNKFWHKPGLGIQLDAGAFITGLEFATSKNATLIGKPSKLYFEAALVKINSDSQNSFIMLGDDLDSDINGAKNFGATTILIYTGKTIPPFDSKYKNIVDYEAFNFNDVIKILERINKND